MAVLVSTNGGESFTGREIPAAANGRVRAVAVNPQDDRTIYVGGHYYPQGAFQAALFKTTDGGAVWEDIRGTIEDVSVEAIEVDPIDPNIVMVLAGGSLYKSNNAGASWSEITPPQGIRVFRINPEAPNEIYASSGDDFLLSEDGGRAWTSLAGEGEIGNVTGIDLTPSVKLVYAGTSGGGIFRNRLEALYMLIIAAGHGGTTDPGPGFSGHVDGATIDITAVPHRGYTFRHWSGDRSGTDNPLRITMDSDIMVQAMFRLAAPSGFSVARQEASSLLRIQYINILSWTRITEAPGVAGYRIYLMNGGTPTLLAEVDASTSTFWHRGVTKDGVYRYGLAAVDTYGTEGETARFPSESVNTRQRLAGTIRRR